MAGFSRAKFSGTMSAPVFKSFLKRQLTARDLWFQRKTGVLINNPASELRFDLGFAIAHLLQRRDPLTFVQIGAYDGMTNDALADFIRRGKLRGLLVEPQPEVFGRLVENNRGNGGLSFENCAVGAESGDATFYRVKSEYEHLVDRSRQMSGFSPDVILKHYRTVVPDAQAVLETIRVPSMPLAQLLAKHSMKAPDLLQIDTEGHDYAILSSVDFSTVRPAIIGYETAHLSREDKVRSYELLIRNDYLIYEAGLDCLAYDRAARESAPGFWH